MQKYLGRFGIMIFILVVLWGVVEFYPYLFSKNVTGLIENVDRVPINVAMMVGNQEKGQQQVNPQLYSYAVAIRDSESKRIYTASSEDRQWAVAEKGKCVEAKLLRYPPWKLDKAGTFYGARLLELYDCSTEPSN